jgi:SAM-dependent methyltransferase
VTLSTAAPRGVRWVAGGAWTCLRDPLALTRLVRRRAIAEHAGLARGTLVDVGAGQQPYAGLFSGAVDRIIAVDVPGLSPRAGIDVWADAQALPLRAASVDTVFCAEVLEYLVDPRRAFAEFSRVLRCGGRLLLTAPQLRGESDEANDYWRFGRPGLRLLAEEAGLTEIEIVPCGGFCAAWGQRASSALYGALTRRGLVPVAVARAACGLIQAPCWLAEQASLGARETLHWLMTARRP